MITACSVIIFFTYTMDPEEFAYVLVTHKPRDTLLSIASSLGDASMYGLTLTTMSLGLLYVIATSVDSDKL